MSALHTEKNLKQIVNYAKEVVARDAALIARYLRDLGPDGGADVSSTRCETPSIPATRRIPAPGGRDASIQFT